MNTLLRFTTQNFRSICSQHSIILSPRTNITDAPQTNIADFKGTKYLKSIAIYGANSSGKSNCVLAIGVMCNLVRKSNKLDPGEPLPYSPFLLDETSASEPTLFEMEFFVDGVHYCYGFTYNKEIICGEWLRRIGSMKKEQVLFLRDQEGIGVNEDLFPEGKDKEEFATDNRLFLPLVAQMNGAISKSIFRFFFEKINILSGLDTEELGVFTKMMLKNQMPGNERMKSFFARTQLGFSDVAVRQIKIGDLWIPSNLSEAEKNYWETMARQHKDEEVLKVETFHGIYDNEGNQIGTQRFDFDNMESSGTKKLFQLAGPIFDTLKNGLILVIDELDAKMHPLLSQELVRLFNNPESNPYGAQLIFTTHDTNLLSAGLLRRDQIWFTEKDPQERTDLYCMMQLKLPDGTTPRRDGNMERNYIQGRYGAIPYIKPYND